MKRDNADLIESTEKRITFAILCAKLVYHQKDWNTWAERWLSGEDRSAEPAMEAMSMATKKMVWLSEAEPCLSPARAAEAAMMLATAVEFAPEDPSSMAAPAAQMAAVAAQSGESEARQAGFELQDLVALSQNVAARYAVADNADQE